MEGGGGGLGLPQRSCSHNHPSPRSGPVSLPTEPPDWRTAPTTTSCMGFLKRSRRGSPLDELPPGPGLRGWGRVHGADWPVGQGRGGGVEAEDGVGDLGAGPPGFHRDLLFPSLDK